MNMTLWISGLASGVAATGVGYAAISAVVAHRFTRARRSAPQRSTSWGDARLDRVTLQPRGEHLNLAAWYFAERPRDRVVILVHGNDGCRGNELLGGTQPLVERLRGRGFSVLALDLRGHGDSAGARFSFGMNESRDVLGAVDWLMARGYDTGRIGVFGASMGGAAALAAAEVEPAIGAVATDSTAADFGEMMGHHQRELSGLPRCVVPGGLAMARWLTGRNGRQSRPVETLRGMQGRPMLVIHSRHDPLIPVTDALRLAAQRGARLMITESDRHLGSFEHDHERYASEVVAFFDCALVRP